MKYLKLFEDTKTVDELKKRATELGAEKYVGYSVEILIYTNGVYAIEIDKFFEFNDNKDGTEFIKSYKGYDIILNINDNPNYCIFKGKELLYYEYSIKNCENYITYLINIRPYLEMIFQDFEDKGFGVLIYKTEYIIRIIIETSRSLFIEIDEFRDILLTAEEYLADEVDLIINSIYIRDLDSYNTVKSIPNNISTTYIEISFKLPKYIQ